MGSETATRLGEVLNGTYELKELVGTEDSVEIYRATEHKTGAGVRVQLLRAEYALQGAVVERFLRAPRSLEKVAHTSLPRVRVETDDTGIPFVVEELVEGRPLEELLEGFPQGLPLGLASHLALPLVEALALAHEHGLLHGAIEPTRVRWLGTPTAPVPKLLELGVSVEDRAPCDAAYRAPELATKARGSKQADVFALGVLLYRMLSGELPFRKGDKRALPLDEVAPQLPAAWVELTTRCLDFDPRQRLTDAGEMLTCLRACINERPSAPSVEPPRESRPKQVSELGFEDTAPESLPEERKSPVPAARDSVPEVRKSTPAVRKPEQRSFEAATAATMLAPAPTKQKPSLAAKPSMAAKPSVAAPMERTMSAVADAFGTLRDEDEAKPEPKAKPAQKEEPKAAGSKKDRKSSARETAEKLSAKSKARSTESRMPSPDAAKPEAAKPEASATDKQDPERKSPAPQPSAAAARQPQRPGNRNQPTQGQIAAVALTEAQLNALRAMRNDDDESKDRWLGFFLMLLFMLLLQAGVPLLYEPNMAAAQQMFGTKMRFMAAGFTVIVVIATARMWAAQVDGGGMVMRVTGFAMQLVAACIVVMAATLFSSGSALQMFAGMARKALPWGMSGLFFMFAFAGALRGARNMASNITYGLLVMMLSTGSLYGSYRAIFSTVLAGTTPAQIAAARAARARLPKSEQTSATDLTKDLAKHAGGGTADPEQWEAEHPEQVGFAERHEVGANEEDDLKATSEINDSRNRNKTTLTKLQEAGPQLPQ